MNKKYAIMLLAVVLSACSLCLPMGALAEEITYIERSWDQDAGTVTAVEKTVSSYTLVTETTATMEDGWYVVEGNITLDNRIEVIGEANLILVDGASLEGDAGIHVPADAVLNIFGQANDSGSIFFTTKDDKNAAIGGNESEGNGTINIYGGTVRAISDDSGAGIGSGYQGSGSEVNIYGGTVYGDSNNGASIGGGMYGENNTVNIYGGTVKAESGTNGAGIGGGEGGAYNTVNIYGGTVEGKSYANGAGIGGGRDGHNNTVNIYGGTVVTDASCGAGIGGGDLGDNNTVNIHGGTVEAASHNGAGIGGGMDGNNNTVNIYGGTVEAATYQYNVSAGIGSGRNGSDSKVNIYGGTVTSTSQEKAFDVDELVISYRTAWVWFGEDEAAAYEKGKQKPNEPDDKIDYGSKYVRIAEGFVITLCANDGTADMQEQDILIQYDDESPTFPSCPFVREGYTFTNWNTEADGTGKSYSVDDPVTVEESIMLYAQWVEEPKEPNLPPQAGEDAASSLPQPDGASPSSPPQTGDEAAPLLWLAAAVASLLGLCLLRKKAAL